MTLAPERKPISPTEPHHVGARRATAAAHANNSRIHVGSEAPRAPRPEFKASGRPTPAAHLSPEEVDAIGAELDALRAEVMDGRGAADAAYIRKMIATQRYLEMGSRAVLLFSGVKVKGIRPAWWIGTAGLSLAKILENMEIGHNVLHGQWDWMRDPKIHSTQWEWDFVSPAKQWKHTHNELHHTYTNVIGRDNDLGYGILRVDPDQKWRPLYLGQPVWHWLNAMFFEYSIAAYDLELMTMLEKWGKKTPEEKKAFFAAAKEVGAKIRRQVVKDYIAHPILSAPTGSARSTLTANLVANFVRNMWANTVIMCGHFPEGVDTFETDSIEGETRGDWYLRQMLGSANISGSKTMHVMTGNLSHQIEHHLFPDMPSNRYAEVAPKIRDLMERNDLRYVTGSLPKQFASVYKKVLVYSLPNPVEGKTRLQVIADELAANRRKKAERKARRRARAAR
jgi:fatty acid desaturase